jgi:methyltransferase (TIGR00027 family)
MPLARRLARRDVERRLPGAWLLHQARTRVFDELVLSAARGASQVVLLGAGGDSRPYRFPEFASIRTFEVDHPQTGAWKQARVKRMLERLPEHVRYVPIDFGTDALQPALERAGFDPTMRTFFLWEGVTMYLRPDAVDDVLSLVALSSRGSAIGFDYLYAEAIAHPNRFDGARAQAEFAASRGEPFLFGLPAERDDLASFAEARGIKLAKSWDHRELRATYPGDGFLMPFVGIAHAVVP